MSFNVENYERDSLFYKEAFKKKRKEKVNKYYSNFLTF